MKIRFNYRTLMVICAVVTMMLTQIATTSVATTSPAPAFADADLSGESRTLDTFVVELGVFDKKGADLAKRASLTRAEFVTYERQGEDLKRRVSGVQNALRQVIDKLKAAGQWDNLDQTLLAKINDSVFQNFVRSEGFKKTLEEVAAGRNINVNEIANPVNALRNKVQGQAPGSVFNPTDSTLALRAVRVAYTPAPAMVAASVRCRLSYLRVGISGAVKVSGQPTDRSVNALQCYCLGNQGACDAL